MIENNDVGIIYIAGNDNFGKLEKYNDEKDKYEGLIPNFFRKLEEKSGIDFEYLIYTTTRENAIKNKQVDIVSIVGESDEISDKISIFTLEDGKDISIGFTSIMNDETKNIIKKNIEELTLEEREEILLTTIQEENHSNWETVINTNVIVIFLVVIATLIAITILYIKKLRKKLSKEKYTDNVTGYSNYNNFKLSFEKFITNEVKTSYCLIDLGLNLEHIEEIYGYEEIEKILKNTANILSEALKDNELFCRKTNESFLVLIDYISLKNLEERILQINECIKKQASKHSIKSSFGVYFLNTIDKTLEKATYYALQARKFSEDRERIYTICNNALMAKVNERFNLENDIVNNLKKEEFIGYFQTIMDTKKKEIFAIEILARWENAKQGFIKPKKFLKILEKNNLVYQLDLLMLKNACDLLKTEKNTRVFCNFSKSTLQKERTVEEVRLMLYDYGIQPHMLGIVIEEDVFINRTYKLQKVVNELKELGVSIILDNFGESIYSLKDLSELDCDYIKFAPSMIENLEDDRKQKVLHELIKLAHGLEIEVICENIENEETEQILNKLNCRYLQGNLYSPAIPLDELKKLEEKIENKV